jgi:hypothetical protein
MMFLMDAFTVGFLGVVLGRLVGLVLIDRPWTKPTTKPTRVGAPR